MHSEHGLLAALEFAAALRLAAPQLWMWPDDGQVRAHLHRAAGLSRSLIRGSSKNLASHVLRHLPAVFLKRYGCRPWPVESFVEEGREGTCRREANFLPIGGAGDRTGRTGGRQGASWCAFSNWSGSGGRG